MLEFGIFLLILEILFSFWFGFKIGFKEDDLVSNTKKLILYILSYLILLIIGLVCISSGLPNKKINYIDPIEVYRGNTSLKITVIDGIPQDSIVILKRKEK